MDIANVPRAARLVASLRGIRALLGSCGRTLDFMRFKDPRSVWGTSIGYDSGYPNEVDLTSDEIEPALRKAESRLVADLRSLGVKDA